MVRFYSIFMLATLALLTAPVVAQDAVDVTGSEAEVKEITVRSEGFDFIPSEIRVREGDTIRLTYENTGGFHDWVLDEFDAETERLTGGSSETIEFVADEPGEYEFYCSVGNHRARGMLGTFIVVADE